MQINWLKYASPKTFYPLAGKLIPWFSVGAVLLIAYGLYLGLLIAPTDFQQGEGYRIIFVHVPAAWFSMFLYLLMAAYAAIGLILNAKLSHMMAKAISPTGAMFTLAALVTGSFWGKPMWGAWWVWDARLTSELILLFLYLGVIALYAAIPERHMATQTTAILILLGLANLPIIHYSVYWWNTLHQGATIHFLSPSLMERSMLYPLLSMIMAFVSFYLVILLLNIRCKILEQHLNEG